MLRSVKDLEDYVVGATDGIIGHVTDFYFDDKAWVIRYLVVNAGTWIAGRRVLISPVSIGRPDWSLKILPVWMTKEQLKSSPDIDTEKPVSRQHEMRFFDYFGYSYYWGGAGLWGDETRPDMLMPNHAGGVATSNATPAVAKKTDADVKAARPCNDDSRLRSCNSVMRYHIHATDGDIGHVHGLLVDDETWAILYMIVATNHWWAGHHVLIAPQWIQAVSWPDATVTVNVTRQAVRDAPPYDLAAQLTQEQELGVYDHYEHLGYWTTEAKRARAALNR